jgi:hypothetical protein
MKIQKILANISPFADISFVNNEFNTIRLTQLIDNVLFARVITVGFFYSKIFRSLTNGFY